MTDLNGLAAVARAELERASRLMRNHPSSRILNARVEPHWIEGGRRFWYRREQADGHDYVIVEANTAAKTIAFNHVRVAELLSETVGRSIAPTALPVTEFDGRFVVARIGDAIYRCDVQTLAVTSITDRSSWLISPDGTQAILRRNGDLWCVHIATGRERPLTNDGEPHWGYGMPSDRYGQNKLQRDREKVDLPPVQSWWSPDGCRLVTARLDQRHLAEYPYLENAPIDGSFRPKVHGVRLPLMGEAPGVLDYWVIDTDTGEKRPLQLPVERMTAANNGIDDLKIDWSPDGATMLAISGIAGLVGAEAFAIDLATGKVKTIIEDRSTPCNPLVAGGYGRPVARFIKCGTELLWWSGRGGWGHIDRYDVATGELINHVTDGDWLLRDIVAVDDALNTMWFTAMGREPGNPYYRYLYRIDLDGSDLELMTPETGDHMIVDPTGSEIVFDGAGPTPVVAPDFKTFVYDVSSVCEPTRTLLRRSDGKSLIAEIEAADADGLFAAGYRPPEEFTAIAANGCDTLHGLVYRPSNHDPRRRYAVLDVEYGNPAVAITPRTFAHAATFAGTAPTPAALAELGFVVVVVDARGTPYRDRAFTHPPPDYLETMGIEDHIAFIRAVAASDPTLDLDRVGIAGQSFGGYTAVSALLRFPEFFKVAVAGAPQLAYHNMAAEDVLTCSRGAPRYGDGLHLRVSDDEVPENFAALDLAASLDRLEGHLLIVAGELDENVYPGTIQQFFAKAVHDNRNVDLIWMPGMAHDALFTPYALRRTIDYLLRHLQRRVLPDILPALPDPRRTRASVSY